jgi:hypothetical protein
MGLEYLQALAAVIRLTKKPTPFMPFDYFKRPCYDLGKRPWPGLLTVWAASAIRQRESQCLRSRKTRTFQASCSVRKL